MAFSRETSASEENPGAIVARYEDSFGSFLHRYAPVAAPQKDLGMPISQRRLCFIRNGDEQPVMGDLEQVQQGSGKLRFREVFQQMNGGDGLKSSRVEKSDALLSRELMHQQNRWAGRQMRQQEMGRFCDLVSLAYQVSTGSGVGPADRAP
jgi:hypothetical protein